MSSNMDAQLLHVAWYGLWPEFHDRVRQNLPGKSIFYDQKVGPDNADANANVVAVFVESSITAETLQRFPNVRLIATMSTGFDHIDNVAAKARGITVANVPSYGENTVAEHTFALLLALTRRLIPSVNRVKEGQYEAAELRGVDIKGKTIGVVGTGHIGAQVIHIATAFGMKVVAYDVFPNEKLVQECGFTYVPLEQLFEMSDVVTLHTPLLPSTEHLINANAFKRMKRGAYLINTARGALIDPEALATTLQADYLGGVGLDVLEEEGLIHDEEKLLSGGVTPSQIKISLYNKVIIDHPKVIVTPHNAFNSQEAIERIVDATIDNIIAFAKGTPKNLV